MVHHFISGDMEMKFRKKDDEVLNAVSKTIPSRIAEELVGVQPMPHDVIKNLMDASSTEEELLAAGYEPVCPTTRLMWRKKNGD